MGEIEEEDGTITVAHPSFIVMKTYFMGLGRYTIVMGKERMSLIFCFRLAFFLLQGGGSLL